MEQLLMFYLPKENMCKFDTQRTQHTKILIFSACDAMSSTSKQLVNTWCCDIMNISYLEQDIFDIVLPRIRFLVSLHGEYEYQYNFQLLITFQIIHKCKV